MNRCHYSRPTQSPLGLASTAISTLLYYLCRPPKMTIKDFLILTAIHACDSSSLSLGRYLHMTFNYPCDCEKATPPLHFH